MILTTVMNRSFAGYKMCIRDRGWMAVWEKVLCGRISDEKIKKMIVEMGGAFFEKNAAAMEQRLKECALDIHKQIEMCIRDSI